MNDTLPIEVLEPNAIEAIQRAEVDVQISTAKKYPRQLSAVKKSMMDFATLDQETAESCFYTLPRGGKNIQGPSVRLAEIAVSCYGNLRAGSRIIATVADGPNPHVIVQAVAHDLEKNVAVTVEKRRRITKKKSKDRVDEDDINLAANAGSSIAFRDAVYKVVPLALIKPVYEAAKAVAIGDAKTLVDRRARALESLAKMGVQKERVLEVLGKKSIEDIGVADLETLFGIHTAIKDGQTTIDEAFPAATPKPNFATEPKVEVKTETAPETKAAEPDNRTPQQFITDWATAYPPVSFDDFRGWLKSCGRMQETDSLASFDDVPGTICEALKKEPKSLEKCKTLFGQKD